MIPKEQKTIQVEGEGEFDDSEFWLSDMIDIEEPLLDGEDGTD